MKKNKSKKRWRVVLPTPVIGSFTFAEALKAIKEIIKEEDVVRKECIKKRKIISKRKNKS